MPIFEKAGERVYFAHIPKAAGSAVYLLFLRNGWSISNVDTGRAKGRIGAQIADEFGIARIPEQGGRGSFKGALQHAPAELWQGWGPFDSSFAISREPFDRFHSAMRYVYTRRFQLRSFAGFKERKLRSLERQFAKGPVRVQNVFRPAHILVAPDTHVFRYEDDWLSALATLYALDPARLTITNRTPPVAAEFGPAEAAFVRRHYQQDFARFGYDSGPA